MMLIAILISCLSSYLTFEFSKIKYFGAIRASAILTLLFYIDLLILNYFFLVDIDFFLSIFFGGSFIGMSCPSKVGYYSLFGGAIIFSVLFIYLLPYLPGMGGALGLSAFLSVFLVLSIKKIIKHTTKTF